jgi:hypothetical protein
MHGIVSKLAELGYPTRACVQGVYGYFLVRRVDFIRGVLVKL